VSLAASLMKGKHSHVQPVKLPLGSVEVLHELAPTRRSCRNRLPFDKGDVSINADNVRTVRCHSDSLACDDGLAGRMIHQCRALGGDRDSDIITLRNSITLNDSFPGILSDDVDGIDQDWCRRYRVSL